RPHAKPVALALLGIDNLTAIEDLFGPAIGDEILTAIEHRIATLLPQGAKLWRAGYRRLGIAVPDLDRAGISA
ncbi:MAG: diguanylate cyclase, partial [Xanthomonadales bacterium]|nr:diguanylate cyclase [Xanthomonadales bacterium]